MHLFLSSFRLKREKKIMGDETRCKINKKEKDGEKWTPAGKENEKGPEKLHRWKWHAQREGKRKRDRKKRNRDRERERDGKRERSPL